MKSRGIILSLSLALAAPVLLVPTVAFAQAEVEAEKLRLIEECNKLASRNAWAGVERCYEKLEVMRVELPFEVHYLGSQSARYLGKTFRVYERLLRSKELDPRPEIFENLDGIDKSYGRVEIIGSEKKRVPLTRDVMPFAPDQRKSIEWAQTVMEETGSFKGMLPQGSYKVGSQDIVVEPGPDWQAIDVRKDKSSSRVGLIEWKGLVASVGPNFGWTNTPGEQADLRQLQPMGFASVGGSLSVGYELGFLDPIGVAAGFSYASIFGSDTYHGVSGWLNLVVRPGDLRLGVGPTYNYRYLSGSGIVDWFDRNHDRDANPNSEMQYIGFTLAPGAMLDVSYGLLDVGPFRGVVGVNAGWSTDGVRQYLDAGLRFGIVPAIDRFEQ